MVMMSLCCAIVGEGGVAVVDIDDQKLVGHLKECVAKETNLCLNAPHKLTLYLAKKDGSKCTDWMTSADYACISRDDAILATYLTTDKKDATLLDPTRSIEDYFAGAPKKNTIHVLVVVPPDDSNMLHIGVDEGYADQIIAYRRIAERLKDSDEVESLSNDIARMIEERKHDHSTPFFVLENSSGTGKTQMAFNLQARGDCDVFYIVCGLPGDREQSVYDAYATRMRTFQFCVRSDLKTLRSGTISNCVPLGAIGQILGNTKLALYGFILAALHAQNVFRGPAQRMDVERELERRQKRGAKPFVFFLDEFPRAGSDKDERELENSRRTMRNVFISFGLPVVVSSTNGTARNLFAISSRSRGSGPSLWCVMVPSLPHVVLNCNTIAPALVMDIIRHSRPLFAELAIKYMQDKPYIGNRDLRHYLDAMAGTLATRFNSLKKKSDEFTRGQLCLLLCTSSRVLDDKINIIDGHFARLEEQSSFKLTVDENGQLSKGSEAWTCRAVLPSPVEDMLLHLTMTGGLSFRPFAQRLHMVMSQSPVHCDNIEQCSNDGMHLEALTTAAIVLASHAGGFGGIAFPRFVRELLLELGVSESSDMLQLPRDVENVIVPFLSPPNARWPVWLNDSSIHFDNLVRTRNEDRIDFRTTLNLISGECKDYSSIVDLGVVQNILERVPPESTFHFVVTRNLHFTGESWDSFVSSPNLQYVDIYRISKGSTLEEIGGRSNKRNTSNSVRRIDKLVLFIEHGSN